jgi:Fic family protein
MTTAKYGVGPDQHKERPRPGFPAKPTPERETNLAKEAQHLQTTPFPLALDWDSTVRWDAIAAKGTERALARYQHRFVDFVYDASYLEGNTYTLPEVQTLLDGITVGGKTLTDQQQVLNLRDSFLLLEAMVFDKSFSVSKECSDKLHYQVAKCEALEPGRFRGEGSVGGGGTVNLGDGRTYNAPPTEPGGQDLKRLFSEGWAAIQQRCHHPVEQGAAYFALAAHTQFYFDGNKRTGRFVMNGHLMVNGYDAISVPAARALEFNEALQSLYVSSDATAIIELLYEIYRESEGF